MQRVIACLDIDYFYAQAEEVRDPSLKGRPVVVCVYSGRTEESGAVATCNYVARRYGVKAGMPIYQAKRALEGIDATFLPVDMNYYKELSKRFMALVERYVDELEVASIDEAYMDVSEHVSGDFSKARRHFSELKSEIRKETGLTCSIGVGVNKVVAKMAADACKPDGLLVIEPAATKTFLAERPIEDLPYVGKKTAERLREMGINTIGELSEVDPQLLIDEFGEKVGTYLHLASRGEYYEPVESYSRKEQVSRIRTLKRNAREVEGLMSELEDLISWLHKWLLENELAHRGIGVMGVTTALQTVSRTKTLEQHNQDIDVIRRVARQLFSRMFSEIPGLELRRAGVKLYDLLSVKGQRKITEY